MKTNIIKNAPIITDKKFEKDFEIFSNMSEKLPSPTKLDTTDKNLKPKMKTIDKTIGPVNNEKRIKIEHTPNAFLTNIEQLCKKSNPSET